VFECFPVTIGGAARGGKSMLLSLWQQMARHAYPGTRGLIGRSELTNLERTTLKTFKHLLGIFGFTEDDYTHNQQKNFIIFPNAGKDKAGNPIASEIILMDTKFKPSDDLGLKFGSLELTDAAIDESNETDLRIIQNIAGRVGTHLNEKYGLKEKVFESFNPSMNHIRRRYWVPFINLTEVENRKFVRALPKDNPSREAQNWIKGKIADYESGDMSESEFKRLVDGDFDYDSDPARLVEYNDIQDAYHNRFIKPDQGKKCLTIDVALDGSDRLILIAWIDRMMIDKLVVDRSSGKEVVQKIAELMAKWHIKESHIIYDADGAGNFIGGRNGFFPYANPFKNGSRPIFIKSGKNNYRTLKDFCAFKLAKALRERKYYFLAVKDDSIIKEDIDAELLQLKERNRENDTQPREIIRKDEMIKALGRSPDWLDAILMREYLDYAPKRENIGNTEYIG